PLHPEQPRDAPGTSSNVKDLCPFRDGLQRIGMARRIAELQVVMARSLLLDRIERTLVQESCPMRDAAERRFHHLPGVGDAVHPANLGSVISGDRQLADAQSGMEELE